MFLVVNGRVFNCLIDLKEGGFKKLNIFLYFSVNDFEGGGGGSGGLGGEILF